MEISYQINGEIVRVRLDPQADGSTRATIGDRVYNVRAQQDADGRWTLWMDGIRKQAYVAAEGDRRYVHVIGEGDSTLAVSTGRRKRRGTGGTKAGALIAQMPGQVVEVLVITGQTVTAGQVLLVLEAMKMEIRVTAAQDGQVARVLVAAGDVVQRDQPLLEMAAPA